MRAWVASWLKLRYNLWGRYHLLWPAGGNNIMNSIFSRALQLREFWTLESSSVKPRIKNVFKHAISTYLTSEQQYGINCSAQSLGVLKDCRLATAKNSEVRSSSSARTPNLHRKTYIVRLWLLVITEISLRNDDRNTALSRLRKLSISQWNF